MTREEEIKQAIENNLDVSVYTPQDGELLKETFYIGAKWADDNPKSPWISVKDDLPCNHEGLIIKHDDWEILETKPVFVHYKNGGFDIRHMWKPKNEPWIWFPNTSDIDYWMPIPELPKE